MEGLRLDLALLLKAVNNILVAPANLVGQTLWHLISSRRYQLQSATDLDGAVLAAGLQPQHPESLRNDHALLLVVGGRDALEELEPLEGGSTARRLVGNHSTDSAVEDFGGGAVMEGARLLGVDDVAFVEEVVVAKLVHWCKESVCGGQGLAY